MFRLVFFVILLFHISMHAFNSQRKIYAVKNVFFDDTYSRELAVGISKTRSALGCIVECTNEKRCLSVFYNKMTKECVLQSDPFTYTVPTSESGSGWGFYRITDGRYKFVNLSKKWVMLIYLIHSKCHFQQFLQSFVVSLSYPLKLEVYWLRINIFKNQRCKTIFN